MKHNKWIINRMTLNNTREYLLCTRWMNDRNGKEWQIQDNLTSNLNLLIDPKNFFFVFAYCLRCDDRWDLFFILIHFGFDFCVRWMWGRVERQSGWEKSVFFSWRDGKINICQKFSKNSWVLVLYHDSSKAFFDRSNWNIIVTIILRLLPNKFGEVDDQKGRSINWFRVFFSPCLTAKSTMRENIFFFRLILPWGVKKRTLRSTKTNLSMGSRRNKKKQFTQSLSTKMRKHHKFQFQFQY